MAEDVAAEVRAALDDIARSFKDEFALIDEVVDFAQGVLTSGSIPLDFRGRRVIPPFAVHVSLSQLTKAVKTLRSIRAVCAAGCGQDASTLLRSLFETMVAVLYMLRAASKKRAILLTAHEDLRTLVMIEIARKTKGQKRTFKKAALLTAQAKVDRWKEILSADEIQSVRKHWAGSDGLEGALRKIKWPRMYILYRHLSAFPHGSDSTSHILVMPGDNFPTFKVLPGEDKLDRVLPMSVVVMCRLLAELNQRFGLNHGDRIRQFEHRSVVLAAQRRTAGTGTAPP